MLRENETGEATFRQLKNGKYVVIICFPHDVFKPLYGTVDRDFSSGAWRKSHMVHASYGPGTAPKQFKGIGQCFEYSKKHYRNCIISSNVSLPLASSDPLNASDLMEGEAVVG